MPIPEKERLNGLRGSFWYPEWKCPVYFMCMHFLSLSCRNRQHLHTLKKWTETERRLRMYVEDLKKGYLKKKTWRKVVFFFFNYYLCYWVISTGLLRTALLVLWFKGLMSMKAYKSNIWLLISIITKNEWINLQSLIRLNLNTEHFKLKTPEGIEKNETECCQRPIIQI